MNLALEIGIGFVVGACIVRAMPRLIPSRWLISLSLAGIGVVVIVGLFVFPFHERMLVMVAVLASYVLTGSAFRTQEVRARYGDDDLILLGLALLAVVAAGAILGYSLLAILAGLGSPTILVLAFAGSVMIATGFGLIALFMDRSAAPPPDRRTISEAARVVEREGALGPH